MKNNRNRLFEMMGKINKDFINEDVVPSPEQQNPDFRLQTYGDLKKIINVIKLQQRGKQVAGVAFDVLLGSIPFLGSAKTAYDVYKAAFQRPDTKKTNTWLDKIDVDDKLSAIVDDTVESGFMKVMSDVFNREPDDKQLEPDFNMNQKLIEYLHQNYSGRTVSMS